MTQEQRESMIIDVFKFAYFGHVSVGYGIWLCDDKSEPEFIFKTFDRGNGVYVTLLEENREMIGHGTTGLISWQGALFLSDWAHNNPTYLKGKRILELGSGVGMLGISLLKTLPMKEFIFTDCHYKVLNFLLYNLKINFGKQETEKERKEMQICTSQGPATVFKENQESKTTYRQQVSQEENGKANTCDVTIRHLDWSKFNANDFKKVDVILGSDIVYERTILPAMCDVIKILLSKSDSANPICFIACTERSQTTLQCFEKAMEEKDLNFEVIQRGMYGPNDHILCSDVLHQMTKIYKINLKAKPRPSNNKIIK